MGATADFETLNMESITIETFTRLIKEDFEDEIYTPIIGFGKSAIGKTMSICELAEELGIGYCELRLVTLTETDMLGIPIEKDGRTTYASNDLLPDLNRDPEVGILVLDEITSASATIRAAAYQLLDSKRALGNYKLPPKWKVLALGNGPSDGGVFTGVEFAFLSRCMCYRIEPDMECWKKWAVAHGVNPSVVAYVSWDPQNFHNFNPDTGGEVFPSPRSWVALSTKLNAREKRAEKGVLKETEVMLYAAGAVGARLAPNFAAFYGYNGKMIPVEDIIAGKASTDLSDTEPQTVYITLQKVFSELQKLITNDSGDPKKNKPMFNAMINVFRWLIGIAKSGRKDYAITAFQDIFSNIKCAVDIALMESFDEACPEFLQFAVENDVLTSGTL